MKKRRVEICGNIASGKTTLAINLERDNAKPIFESFQSNPFYKTFYQNPLAYSFETELTFLLQHYHEIKKQSESELIISDYSLLQDLAYADVNLEGNRHRIFLEVVEEVQLEIGFPQSVIYITCPENILLERIIERNREAEVTITIDYLKNLSMAIHTRVQSISSRTKLITVSSDIIDFRASVDGIPELKSL